MGSQVSSCIKGIYNNKRGREKKERVPVLKR